MAFWGYRPVLPEFAIEDPKEDFRTAAVIEQYHLGSKALFMPGGGFSWKYLPLDRIRGVIPGRESKDESRTRARHTSSLPFRDLIGGAYELLADEGVFSVCIPPEVLSKFSAECLIKGFCLMTAYKIKSVPRKKEPKRYILVYKKGRIVEPQEYTFCMQNPDGTRSEWYQEIMKDFYL